MGEHQKKHIFMVGNTHIDPIWLWEKAEGMQEVKSTFRSALDRMNEFPEFTFTQSSIAFLEWVEKNVPDMFEEIKERVREGRWEIVGGMWIEPDCNLVSGEGFVRHFLYSKDYVRQKFGMDVVTAYNPDSFGHSSNMPAICSGSGVKYYMMSRPSPPYVTVPPVFAWQSADGSQIIAERTGGEYMAWTRPAIEQNLNESLAAMEKYDQDSMAVFYGVGNHGGGPTIANIRAVQDMIEDMPELDMKFSTVGGFFESLDLQQLPVVQREMGRIFYGCYSSDGEIKQKNRKAEWSLVEAENLACMAKLFGCRHYEYPAKELEKAWKAVMFHQFHDVLAGTAIEPARNMAVMNFGGAIAAARDLIDDAVQAIANRIDTRGEGFALVLVNPCGSEYHGIVEAGIYVPRAQKKGTRLRDPKGKEIPYALSLYENFSPEARKRILFQAKIPAYGYAVYRVIHEDPDIQIPGTGDLHAEAESMSNGILQVKFDPQAGAPCSIVKNGTELLSDRCQFSILEDIRGAWGTEVLEEKVLGSFAAEKSEVIECSPMRAVVRYFLTYGKSELMADYLLEAGSDQLKLRIKLRNAEKQTEITLDIPIAAETPEVLTETAFLAEKKADPKDPKTEHVQHRFADISDAESGKGIAVINNGIYGFHQANQVYRLILLRNSSFAKGAGGELPKDLGGRFMNQGSFDFTIHLLAHESAVSKQRLFAEADFLHMPVEILGDSNHAGDSGTLLGQALSMTLENVHPTGIKKALRSDDSIIRVIETEGIGGQVQFPGEEEPHVIGPYQIRTFRKNENEYSECTLIETNV